MLTNVTGVQVGHCTDVEHQTGCTVVIFDSPTMGGVDVQGAMPATKDTDSLRLGSDLPWVDAIVLTGGSCFGLASAFGVMSCLEERGRGVDQRVTHIPVVPAAAMVVNAVGNVVDRRTGSIVAGCRDKNSGRFVDVEALYKERDSLYLARPGQNTTIGVVCCDCKLTREEANRIACIAHNGIARCIFPSHTTRDGDTIFATERLDAQDTAPLDVLGIAAAEAVELAIPHAVGHR
jgi:L-aminopeptidase/D-esterase-like protein